MSQSFNGHGYLPPGLHKMTLSDIEATLVVAFPHSTTRPEIIKGYKKHAQELVQIVSPCEQLIDGSFASNKNDPGDIDMVVFIDADVVDSLSPNQQADLRALLAGPQTKTSHMCDAYFCPMYSPTHAQHAQARQMRKYWLGEFGYDRNEIAKGIIQVDLEAMQSPTTTPGAATP
ncbi:DUF6932 family protein [Bradyrhizobium elkanii]|uniref:DUF6932 family protein n=1 Tax=Bradyrhizobium elkanii TaxID=29448 RepID=UPI003D214D55